MCTKNTQITDTKLMSPTEKQVNVYASNTEFLKDLHEICSI